MFPNFGNFPENSDIRKQIFSLEKKWVFSPKTCRNWHFRNPSALWWGQFAEMAKFLVLVKMSFFPQIFSLAIFFQIPGSGSKLGNTLLLSIQKKKYLFIKNPLLWTLPHIKELLYGFKDDLASAPSVCTKAFCLANVECRVLCFTSGLLLCDC